MADPQLISLIKKNAPVENIRIAIRKGASLRAWDELGQLPLHHALMRGQKETAVLLLEADSSAAALNITAGVFKSAPLHHLAQLWSGGWSSIAAKLIEKGADVDIRDITGKTPLYHATGFGDLSLVGLLIANGAKVDATDGFGVTPLFNARKREIAELLVSNGADIEHRENKKETPIFEAAYWARMEVISFLLEKGASPYAINDLCETPLHGILSWNVDGSPSEFAAQKKAVAMLVEHCGKDLPNSIRPRQKMPKNFNPDKRHPELNDVMFDAHEAYLANQR